ncbi:hypothetical protein DFP75_101885 [Marinomonas alcarazii]|uniref:TIGR01777 family protein n=1 Tax=Marinomonas alcarazii TaxID=491949 RepID=A0A318V9N7_9GAMM|nr:TIGR01777 family oxidoreductase [Marinomonas alcarazii]PYF84843.1 hypothetical protein DFP75_101885 [Marinomonas alcarazii]
MRILLSGATGFIGRSLLATLSQEDHQIYALVRNKSQTLDSRVEQVYVNDLKNIDVAFDVFINLAGEGIANKPWSKKRKQELFDSRVTLTNSIKNALQYPPKTLISMSAVGFYGKATYATFYEDTTPESGFAHDLCAAWEDAANGFSSQQTRVVIYRLGVVLGKGGALEKMRLPFKLGLGGPIAGGNQWFPWVHIDDVIRAICHAMQDETFDGAYNMVAPQYIEQKNFARSYACSLKRPALLPTPKWLLSMMLGEMSSLLTEGAKIVPQRLEERGFEFKFDNVDDALTNIAQSYS